MGTEQGTAAGKAARPALRRHRTGISSQGRPGSRIPEAVPVRHGRMLVSPFTFYYGAALPMAADQAAAPTLAPGGDVGLRELCA